jgi:hypothetical protein
MIAVVGFTNRARRGAIARAFAAGNTTVVGANRTQCAAGRVHAVNASVGANIANLPRTILTAIAACDADVIGTRLASTAISGLNAFYTSTRNIRGRVAAKRSSTLAIAVAKAAAHTFVVTAADTIERTL